MSALIGPEVTVTITGTPFEGYTLADLERLRADTAALLEDPDAGPYTDTLRSALEEATAEITRRECYHPLSCRHCQSAGGACRTHHAGTRGHERCRGRA